MVWTPVVTWGIYKALESSADFGVSPAMVLGALVLGFLIWQALEYSIHRFVFHQQPTSYWGVTVRVHLQALNMIGIVGIDVVMHLHFEVDGCVWGG